MLNLLPLSELIKLFGLIAIWYCLYTAYRLVLVPLRERWNYKKYANVAMNKKYYPVVGDLAWVLKYQDKNKFRFNMFFEVVREMKKYDFYAFQQGPHTIINMLSTEALAEFEKLVPSKIDRFNQYGKFPVGNIVRGSLGQSESTGYFHARRKEATKAIGINNVSKYIPLMIEVVDNWASNVIKDQRIDLSLEMTKIVFKVIAMILFGTDVDQMKPIPYLSPETGKYMDLTLEEFYTTYPQDEFMGFVNPKGTLFPFLSKYGLSEPYKTNIINRKALISELTSFTSSSKDTTSVYKQLEALGVFPKEVIIDDIVLLLFAGFDTVTHLIISCLYQLKRNPDVLERLISTLHQSEIAGNQASDVESMKDAYENCDLLNLVIKEWLRIDGPAMQCIMYFFKEDVTLWGVPFKKGTMTYPNLIYTHNNQSEWHEPRKFIPERFDPESEYFFKPNSDRQPRHPKSFIPFGFGPRNWMGQSLAKLEAKVVISRILTSIDYEIDQDLLDNEDVSFNVYSQFKLYGKIKENRY